MKLYLNNFIESVTKTTQIEHEKFRYVYLQLKLYSTGHLDRLVHENYKSATPELLKLVVERNYGKAQFDGCLAARSMDKIHFWVNLIEEACNRTYKPNHFVNLISIRKNYLIMNHNI